MILEKIIYSDVHPKSYTRDTALTPLVIAS